MNQRVKQAEKVRCENCELVMINGVICHEHGCPTSYLHTFRECEWCGLEFQPKEKNQRYCSPGCHLNDCQSY